MNKARFIAFYVVSFTVLFLHNSGFAQSNSPPTITADFETIIVKEDVTTLDSTWSAPVVTGVSELSLAFATDADGDSLTWSGRAEHLTFVFQDSVLYAVPNGDGFAGYDQATIFVEDGQGGKDSVIVDVVVVQADRTLLSRDGQTTDFYVPDHPQLDINRIISTEQHMRTYNLPDIGLLDKKVRWSRWQKVEEYRGFHTGAVWHNAQVSGGFWNENAQFNTVRQYFEEWRRIGLNSVNLWRGYFMREVDSPEPIEIFDEFIAGLSMTDEDLIFTINEAHRQGFKIVVSPHITEPLNDRSFNPPDFDHWFDAYREIIRKNTVISFQTGADAMNVGNHIYLGIPIDLGRLTNQEWNDHMIRAVNESIRQNYSGPVIYMSDVGTGSVFLPNEINYPLFGEIDIIGVEMGYLDFPVDNNPTLSQVQSHMENILREHVDPIFRDFNKPIVFHEGGRESFDGAIAWTDAGRLVDPDTLVFDSSEQELWYQAYFNATRDLPYAFGFGMAFMSFWPAHGGPTEPGFSIRMKPAEILIGKEYVGSHFEIPFNLDGDMSKWTSDLIAIEDPLGDSAQDSLDLHRVYAFNDDIFFYFRVEMVGEFHNLNVIVLSFDFDGDSQADQGVGIWSRGKKYEWMGGVDDGIYTSIIGAPDAVQVVPSNLEIRFPRFLFPETSTMRFLVDVIDNAVQQRVDYTDYVTYELRDATTSVREANSNLPESVHLHPNYPNPFNPETVIRYELPEAADVQLRIYNLRGQEVRTLVSGVLPPGEHAAVWDGRDKQGAAVASGIYLYRLTTKGFTYSRKMLLLR